MMKVVIENVTYLVHWKTRKFSTKEGKHTEMELEATDCIIRRAIGDSDPMVIVAGHVSQTSSDQSNAVTARKLAFLKAIKDMPRSVRKPLGDEYNRTCRVVPSTSGQKNRKLKKRISDLQKALALANSMILSGEKHSEESETQIKAAMV
jgi:hypothetical protein